MVVKSRVKRADVLNVELCIYPGKLLNLSHMISCQEREPRAMNLPLVLLSRSFPSSDYTIHLLSLALRYSNGELRRVSYRPRLVNSR